MGLGRGGLNSEKDKALMPPSFPQNLSTDMRLQAQKATVPPKQADLGSFLLEQRPCSQHTGVGTHGSQLLLLELHHTLQVNVCRAGHRGQVPKMLVRYPACSLLNSCCQNLYGRRRAAPPKGFKMPGSPVIRVLIKNTTLLLIPILKSTEA